MRVLGDSMEPTLHEGNIVAVDHSLRDPEELIGRLVALKYDGGATIKRLIKTQDGDYCGKPDNPNSSEYRCFKPAQIRDVLIGKVVWWWGRQK